MDNSCLPGVEGHAQLRQNPPGRLECGASFPATATREQPVICIPCEPMPTASHFPVERGQQDVTQRRGFFPCQRGKRAQECGSRTRDRAGGQRICWGEPLAGTAAMANARIAYDVDRSAQELPSGTDTAHAGWLRWQGRRGGGREASQSIPVAGTGPRGRGQAQGWAGHGPAGVTRGPPVSSRWCQRRGSGRVIVGAGIAHGIAAIPRPRGRAQLARFPDHDVRRSDSGIAS